MYFKIHPRLSLYPDKRKTVYAKSVILNLPRLLEKYTLTGHGSTSITMDTTLTARRSFYTNAKHSCSYSYICPPSSHRLLYGVRDDPSVRLGIGSFRPSFVTTGECLLAWKQFVLFPFVFHGTTTKHMRALVADMLDVTTISLASVCVCACCNKSMIESSVSQYL
jgi:hypothetical protein